MNRLRLLFRHRYFALKPASVLERKRFANALEGKRCGNHGFNAVPYDEVEHAIDRFLVWPVAVKTGQVHPVGDIGKGG